MTIEPNTTAPEVMNAQRAAAFVGLSFNTFKLRVLPNIPHQRTGRDYLISRRALLDWLEQRDLGSER